MDVNIDLIPDSLNEVENSRKEDTDNNFKELRNSTEQPLRCSARIREQTAGTKNLLAYELTMQQVPRSFKVPTSTENISFWKPGIDREHDCLAKNHTCDFVAYVPGMKILTCK